MTYGRKITRRYGIGSKQKRLKHQLEPSSAVREDARAHCPQNQEYKHDLQSPISHNPIVKFPSTIVLDILVIFFLEDSFKYVFFSRDRGDL